MKPNEKNFFVGETQRVRDRRRDTENGEKVEGNGINKHQRVLIPVTTDTLT